MRKERSRTMTISGMNRIGIKVGRVVEKAPGQDGFLPEPASGSGPELSGQSGPGKNGALDQRVGMASRE